MNEDEIVFRSDLPVLLEEEACCGSDRVVSRAAWVQKPGTTRSGEGPEAYKRLINTVVPARHGSPLEKGLMTVYVEAPVVVWWEWTKHRFMGLDIEDFGFNLESGRYKVLPAHCYIPPRSRPLIEPSGFKPMRPKLIDATDEQYEAMAERRRRGFSARWELYREDLAAGVAREVARLHLGFDIYYAGMVEAKPRTWLQFFSLRNGSAPATTPTYPQWEIEQVAKQCEQFFAERWPQTYRAFNEAGRIVP